MGMSASQMRLLSLTARMSDLEYSGQQISNNRERLSVKTEEVSKNYTDALNKINLNFNCTDTSGNMSTKALTANVLAQCGLGYTNQQRLLVDGAGRVLVTTSMADNYNKSVVPTTNPDGSVTKVHDLDTFLKSYGYTSDNTKTANTDSPKYDKSAVQYYTNLFNKISTSGYLSASDENMGSSDWLSNQLTQGNLTLEVYNAKETDTKTGQVGVFDDVDWASGDTSVTQTDDDTAIEKAKANYDADMAKIQSQDKQFELSQKNIDTEHSAIQTEYDSVKKVIDKNIERSFKTFNS